MEKLIFYVFFGAFILIVHFQDTKRNKGTYPKKKEDDTLSDDHEFMKDRIHYLTEN